MRLKDKVAVITGGSTGIGFETARLFASEGAHVYITGRRADELERAAAEIGPGVTAVQGDVAMAVDLDRLFDLVRSNHGKLDIVFANAGVGSGEKLGSITEESYEFVFGVNVKGTIQTVQKALPLMTGGGSIIMTGSTTGSMGSPNFSIYSASKAAIRSFARCWALDLKGTGIRVNVLSPGPTETPGLRRAASRAPNPDEALKAMASQLPLGRLGKPTEVAAVALFLASAESSFLTGGEIFADGGMAQI
ncbi:SDR family NAD(P)-dependent oxidoreductase [Nitrospirillum amazonense]|nr:SDR family oxidoreductase [Nitrospirillum amazonense]